MDRQDLLQQYRDTRQMSHELSAPLAPEDFRIQSMEEVSPPWWNLGHTTWFFAKNILEPYGLYSKDDARLEYVLNSYYESLGPRIPRAERGQVTRPTTDEVFRFRASVDERMEALLRDAEEKELERLSFLVTTGIHHEQQHQELMVTEVKHILGSNDPNLREPYNQRKEFRGESTVPSPSFVSFEGGLFEFGNRDGGWCFDNELPIHKAYLQDFALMNRLVTNGEYLEFMEADGYSNPLYWLSNGWEAAKKNGWRAPLYWEEDGGGWQLWTLNGRRELDPEEPVSHVSFYEADAFSQWKSQQAGEWKGARLPTEREWEHGARSQGLALAASNLLESRSFHPRVALPDGDRELLQMVGDLWEWSSNHYEPYPGYEPFDGALMEYNGKFMDNQRVLRGGSCATPGSHIRLSYRNFWAPDTRFQFTGIRLAKSLT